MKHAGDITEADITAALEQTGFEPGEFEWVDHDRNCMLNSPRSYPFRKLCTCGDQPAK